jgi:alkylation response protein AidB-like acyl-CoA dehydrogenase
MSQAPHYKANVRDIQFNLFELLEVQKTSLGHAPFDELDKDTVDEVLRSLEKVVMGGLTNSFVEGDRVPLQLDGEGNVTLPPKLRAALSELHETGLHLIAVPARLGGMGAPPSVGWATFELLAGANATAIFYLLGDVISRVIDRLGSEEQKARYVLPMLERRWGGSMVLTEPDAGSDVGAARTKAHHVEGDVWEIEGVKRFITNGDFDGTENIVHLVLARPEGAVAGTKGLSMFIVPKFWVNEDGSLGERNGVVCTNIEKKMGIKGSSTCEMTFGDGKPARGLLVGGKHDGIRQMFHVIEHARMAVGMKSLATLSTAYLNALAYAKMRVQGADLPQAANKAAPRVTILQHADVRRMLMLQKCHAEGLRALALYTASVQDRVEIAGGHGAAAAHDDDLLNDLLLPMVKGYGSEKAYEMLALSLQCFGGSGYTQDYPIEQYIRDQKIDSLYEGTTHIQALDLLLRKVARDGGATLRRQLEQISTTIAALEPIPALAVERAALEKALEEMNGILGALLGKMGESLHHVGLQGNRVLFALAELMIGWLLVRQAEVALRRRVENPAEMDFYDGKLAAVRFYCRNVLPNLTATRAFVEASTLELMEVPEAAF